LNGDNCAFLNLEFAMAESSAAVLAALSLDLVLRTIPSGLFLVDCDQRIVYWNPEAERITGFAANEAVGKHCSFLSGIPCGDGCGLFDPRLVKPIIGSRCSIRSRNGQRIVLLKNVDYLRDATGRVIGGIESFTDITELMDLKESLRRQAAGLEETVRARTRELEAERTRLQEANRELDTFVSTVAHDMRVPLTPIIAYAEYLRSQYGAALDGQATDMLGEIEKQGNRLLHLLEDLLTLARLGHLPHQEAPVDTAAIAREVAAEFSERIARKGIECAIGALPPLYIPPSFVFQLFLNLVGNALSYGAPAGSRVEVGGCADGESARLYVRDHGPGIAADEKPRLFDPFYRGTAAAGISGTGIGLAIVRKIVRLYDGRIWVEETPGGGATFCLEFSARPRV
jgi:PAS domain S-box-containing protein